MFNQLFLITQFFSMTKPHKELLALMIEGITLKQTFIISRIAGAIINNSSKEANAKSIHRFLEREHIQMNEFACLILLLFPRKRYTLCMDRTVWKNGDKWVNILALAISIEGLCIPVFWCFLNHKGNSNQKSRIQLLSLFIDTFGTDKIDYLLADREFIGKQWMDFLNKHGIIFCIRLKGSMRVIAKNNESYRIDEIAEHYLETKKLLGGGRYRLAGILVKLDIGRTDDNKLIVVAVNKRTVFNALKLYKKRWGIETMFKKLKTGGFDLESLKVKDTGKINQLFAICSLTFAITYKVGILCQHMRNSPVKKKNLGYSRVSKFSLGLSILQDYMRMPVKPKFVDRVFNKISSLLRPSPGLGQEPKIVLL